MSVSITDIDMFTLAPVNKSDTQDKYAIFTPVHPHWYVSYSIRNVNNAIANGLRRTIACGLLIKCLQIEQSDIATDDPFVSINRESLIGTILALPVMQDAPDDVTGIIDIHNTTIGPIFVTSGNIVWNANGTKVNTTKVVAEDTFPICVLMPKSRLIIKNIHITHTHGYEHGQCVLASEVTSMATDIMPHNEFSEDPHQGVSTTIANPAVWRISYIANGCTAPINVSVLACDDLLTKLNTTSEYIRTGHIVHNNTIYTLSIADEDDTLGNIIMRTTLDINDTVVIVYSVDAFARLLTITIRCKDDPTNLLLSALSKANQAYTHIKQSLSALVKK